MNSYIESSPVLNPGAPLILVLAVLFISTGLFSGLAYSEETATETTATTATDGLSAEEIETLIAPVALYPDELISILLPASTFPLQIVQASRYLDKRKADESLKPDEDWDSSVLGLLNYPEVIEIMNEDLDWTWKLGEAVVNQQPDVMTSIQLFRGKADEAGNLESNEKTVVIKETQVIKIESASPEVIYVPSYNPTTVVVYQTAPYPWVYSTPYPYYYSPAATFWTGMFVGAAISYGVHWHGHHHGHGDININRNVNINRNSTNINRDSIRQNDRNRASQGGKSSNSWSSTRSSTQGGRPGTRPGSVSGRNFNSRATSSLGNRVGDRPGSGQGSFKSSNRASGAQGNLGSGNRATSGQRSKSTTGRAGNSSGSFSGYQRGANTSRNSQRGMSSRSSMSRSSRGSVSGGRGGGGRRR